ncbi:MAG: GEVED domain-containing protein [Candidatus Thiodiazotropha sp.]
MKTTLSALFIFISLFTLASISQAAAGDYCDSNARNANYFWQQSITAGDNQIENGNNGGYNATETPVINLPQGNSSIELNPGYRYYNYTVYWRGWLDLDGDMQFSADEQLFETSSRGPVSVPIMVTDNPGVAQTTLRVTMKYGSYAQPCETYYYGETEDLAVNIEQSDIHPVSFEENYHLSLDHDFTFYRTGSIGDQVSWVVERDGTVALSRSAAGELQFSYFYNLAGTDIRVWLEQFIDGSYQRVSNIVEYTPGTTDQYELTLEEGFDVHRTGQIGESLTWVIEKDGEVVLERSASSELSYIYYSNINGSKYRVWLKKFINGQYERVSNTVEYEVGQTEFTLTVDQLNQVRRNGQPGDLVSWVIEEDGQIVLERNASDEMTYSYFNTVPGSSYRIWLQMYLNGQYQAVSNIVEYAEPAFYDYTLSLGPDNEISRSGQVGDSLTWVIVKDGKVVLQRNAANELSYTYFNNTNGSDFKVYLTQFIGGYYRRVSNVVEYAIGADQVSYDLYVDQSYRLTRSGQIGDPATWVIEKDGEIVLERNAANELSYTYFSNTPGSSFRVWLEQYIDGSYQVVSNIVEYTIDSATVSYDLSVDQSHRLTRSGQIGDPATWVIEKDGAIVLQRNAANELSYTYYSNTPGSSFRVWLKQYIGGQYRVVSNVVSYSIPEETNNFTLTLGSGYRVTRSGAIGDNVNWVIIKDGEVALKRRASNELSYTYYSNTVGSTIQVYLEKYISGSYQQVSNTVQYTVQ